MTGSASRCNTCQFPTFLAIIFLRNRLFTCEIYDTATFGVKACDTLEENDMRQCDIDSIERQQVYNEDWVSLLRDCYCCCCCRRRRRRRCCCLKYAN